jgi:hypothetical protein
MSTRACLVRQHALNRDGAAVRVVLDEVWKFVLVFLAGRLGEFPVGGDLQGAPRLAEAEGVGLRGFVS